MFGKACTPRSDHLIPRLEYTAQLASDPTADKTGMSAVIFSQQLRNRRRFTVLTC